MNYTYINELWFWKWKSGSIYPIIAICIYVVTNEAEISCCKHVWSWLKFGLLIISKEPDLYVFNKLFCNFYKTAEHDC